jgi:UDP-N-acetylmuramoyl-tripeptide--D-alanyl-D-alanine ligase
MSTGTLQELADQVGGVLHGADARFDGVSTDTRSIARGELFVALKGARYDGADYVDVALAAGAAGALVGRLATAALPQVVVTDARTAFGRHARAWRRRFDLPVVAVTGSNGKTTVKEMIATILARRGPIHATRGNLNNDIGVPVTLAQLSAEHRAAVIEVGTSHPGEIAYLAHLCLPTIGVLTNAAPAHLQGFGSVAAVAREKGALLAALPPDGTAVINADDPHAGLWEAMAAERRIVRFGTRANATFACHDVQQRIVDGRIELEFRLRSPAGDLPVRLPLAGPHNALNATCAAAAAWAAGATPDDIVEGLASARAVGGRLHVLTTTGGARLIDDSYNANPASMEAAINCLAALPEPRWLVVGDMAELGPDQESLHEAVGAAARRAGITRLYATGPLSRCAVRAFGPGGEWFDGVESLIDALGRELRAPATVLVKASRSSRLERVVAALSAPRARPPETH